jgi:hypothetical protein
MGVPVADGEVRTLAAVSPSATPAPEWPRLLALAGAVLALAAYRAVGREFYDGFALPLGIGMTVLLPAEISAFAVFIVFGGLAWGLLAVALAGTRPVEVIVRLVGASASRPWVAAAAAAALLALASWTLAHVLLRHAVTSDDEHVYRFIGQTLAGGRLTAPSPGGDLAFYREQFVVLTDRVRFGKYPIGHPALLALGQRLGVETLVVPLIVGLTAFATVWLGQRVTTRTGTIVALILFASSPQVLCTGATLLSQPAAALCLTVALAALVESDRSRRPLGWAALSGLSLACGLLVRPLPGVLFAGAAAAWYAWRARSMPLALRARLGLALVGPIVIAGGVLLLVNRLQAGSALQSGYQAFHATGQGVGGLRDFVAGGLALRAMSVFATLFRLDVWLFGWPLSLLFLPFARRTGASSLLWVMVGAELAYRVITPKAGIGGTGPIYFFEVVPLLSVLTADGAVRARGRLAPARLSAAVPATLLAGALVAVSLFVPDRLRDLSRMGQAQRAAPDLIERHGISEALVFHEGVVPPWTQANWAYFPRCNSPALDDDVLYVRFQREGGDLEANLDFWRRRHPDRSALYFGWPPGGEPFLMDLGDFIRTQQGGLP